MALPVARQNGISQTEPPCRIDRWCTDEANSKTQPLFGDICRPPERSYLSTFNAVMQKYDPKLHGIVQAFLDLIHATRNNPNAQTRESQQRPTTLADSIAKEKIRLTKALIAQIGLVQGAINEMSSITSLERSHFVVLHNMNVDLTPIKKRYHEIILAKSILTVLYNRLVRTQSSLQTELS